MIIEQGSQFYWDSSSLKWARSSLFDRYATVIESTSLHMGSLIDLFIVLGNGPGRFVQFIYVPNLSLADAVKKTRSDLSFSKYNR